MAESSASEFDLQLHRNILQLQEKIELLAKCCGVPKISMGSGDSEAIAQMTKVVDVVIKVLLDSKPLSASDNAGQDDTPGVYLVFSLVYLTSFRKCETGA